MSMKQTQTKLFEFSDVGLDFCPGSKNLFPDRFKKILAFGYNVQTVSGIAVAGNKVTLTYGGAHGYVANRVLKIDSGILSSINNGEFWVDSVTTSTVTFTLDGAPASILSGFTTRVAPLGWTLMYEKENVHVYKMKHIDDSDRYVRYCFQDNASHRNAIAICIGKSFNPITGSIDDINALQATKNVLSPSSYGLPRWDFSLVGGNSIFNDYTYSQGAATFGKGAFIGSQYHFIMLNHSFYRPQFNAILPVGISGYSAIQYPILLCTAIEATTEGDGLYGSVFSATQVSSRAYLGNIRCRFDPIASLADNTLSAPLRAQASILSGDIDNFNTTTCMPISIFEHKTGQFLGFCMGAFFALYINDAEAPPTGKTNLPLQTSDVDLNSLVFVHEGAGSSGSSAVYVAVPVEEVRIA